jgi:glycosyltransferase involved in cell wall biosynthesis
MKILWISHDPIQNSSFVGGLWKDVLFKAIILDSDYEIFVAYPNNKCLKNEFGNYTFRFPIKREYKTLPKTTVRDLLWILNDLQPDLIHIHGTEKPYGLIKEFTKIPILISLQGFITECYNSLLAEIPLPIWKRKRTIKEILMKNSFLDMHNIWFYNSAYEKKIIKLNNYFAGRTNFDNKFVFKFNNQAHYFLGHELLRDEFYHTQWDILDIKRYSLYVSSFANPLKGFHILLEAASYLVREFPDLQIIVPGTINWKMRNKFIGNSYYRILSESISNYKLQNHIFFKGKLSSNDISGILKSIHIFVMPSFIENSSNALGEAQIVGTPCVVSSNCGGTSSIIIEHKNGLFFDKGDAFDLSLKIREIFLHDELAIHLSNNSRIFGNEFHNRVDIVKQYKYIYQYIVNNNLYR